MPVLESISGKTNGYGMTTSNTAHRLHIQFESKTDFMENYRGYMNGETNILANPPMQLRFMEKWIRLTALISFS